MSNLSKRDFEGCYFQYINIKTSFIFDLFYKKSNLSNCTAAKKWIINNY